MGRVEHVAAGVRRREPLHVPALQGHDGRVVDEVGFPGQQVDDIRDRDVNLECVADADRRAPLGGTQGGCLVVRGIGVHRQGGPRLAAGCSAPPEDIRRAEGGEQQHQSDGSHCDSLHRCRPSAPELHSPVTLGVLRGLASCVPV